MTRRKPSVMTYLERGAGRKIPGSTITEQGAALIMGRRDGNGPSAAKATELAHRWMSKDKRRTHKRERREGKRDGRTDD